MLVATCCVYLTYAMRSAKHFRDRDSNFNRMLEADKFTKRRLAFVEPLIGARRMHCSIAECDSMQQSIKDKRFAVCCRVLDVRKSTELSRTIPGGRFHANRDQVS